MSSCCVSSNMQSQCFSGRAQSDHLIIATAQNKYVSYAIGPIEAQTRRFWYLHFRCFGDLQRVCKLHAAIARTVSVNDEAGAKAASDNLLNYVEECTFKTLRFMGGL